jgi:hypothetical protein
LHVEQAVETEQDRLLFLQQRLSSLTFEQIALPS